MSNKTHKYNGGRKRRRRTRKQVLGQGQSHDNKKTRNCKSDIFQVKYKVKIPGNKQHILVEPKMLDKSISGLQTKTFYLSCLTKFKENSLNKQENENALDSFFKAIKGTRSSGVPSNIVKIMSNREHLKHIVNWLIQTNISDVSVEELYNMLYKYIGDNIQISADFEIIEPKIVTELKGLDDIIKDIIYSFRNIDNVRISLNKIKIIIQNASQATKEIKQVKTLLTKTEELITKTNNLLSDVASASEDNFNHNANVALKALFQKGKSFYFAEKEYFIKSIVKTTPPTTAKRSDDFTTVYANLILVETKDLIKDYGKLDCNEQKKHLSALINDIYGNTLGRIKYTYDTSRYYASKIGNKIYNDAQNMYKRNSKARERQRLIRKKGKFIDKILNMNELLGGTRKRRVGDYSCCAGNQTTRRR